MRFNTLKRFLRAEGGVAAIEMGFILPFMLFLYFGLIDLTGLISYNRKITSIASATADLVAQHRATVNKSPEIDDYFKISGMIMNPVPADEVTVVVSGFRQVDGNVTRIWRVNNSAGPGCSQEPSTEGMASLMVAGNDLIVAQACSQYKTHIGAILGTKILGETSFTVEQDITLRPRASTRLDCRITDGGSACPNT